jgi:hypothetical protein
VSDQPLKRYDMVTNYRCGSSIEEMEPSDDGEWMRFEDHERLAAQLAAIRRYDSIVEMERADDYGDWVRWEDVAALLSVRLQAERAPRPFYALAERIVVALRPEAQKIGGGHLAEGEVIQVVEQLLSEART